MVVFTIDTLTSVRLTKVTLTREAFRNATGTGGRRVAFSDVLFIFSAMIRETLLKVEFTMVMLTNVTLNPVEFTNEMLLNVTLLNVTLTREVLAIRL